MNYFFCTLIALSGCMSYAGPKKNTNLFSFELTKQEVVKEATLIVASKHNDPKKKKYAKGRNRDRDRKYGFIAKEDTSLYIEEPNNKNQPDETTNQD